MLSRFSQVVDPLDTTQSRWHFDPAPGVAGALLGATARLH